MLNIDEYCDNEEKTKLLLKFVLQINILEWMLSQRCATRLVSQTETLN